MRRVRSRCSWWLSCRDRVDTDTVSLTQEFLTSMLGVQRTTVTVVARVLQANNLIGYHRSVVDIPDRQGHENWACECYDAVRQIYDWLISLKPERCNKSRPGPNARASRSQGGQRAGAGLGLALVNRFLELHDGWVEIESLPQGGTLVRCHIPRRIHDTPRPDEGTEGGQRVAYL